MKKILLLLALVLLLTGCGSRKESRTVYAMDTVMNLTAYGPRAKAALDSAEAEISWLESLLARGVPESQVYAYNHGKTSRDTEFLTLLDRALEIQLYTKGAFDPQLGAVLDLWGFGSGAPEHRVPTDEEVTIALIGGRQLDLGGIAKGAAGDKLRALLTEKGVRSAVLDLGGDVALVGQKPGKRPWRVAVKDPADDSAFLGILDAEDCCVMTSGVYERYFEQDGVLYHHIIDPATGYPADNGIVSATVICQDGVWADALATAICVLGEEEGVALRSRLAEKIAFDLILVTTDGRVLYTTEKFTPETGKSYTYKLLS